jgi:hypothetical protein
LGLGFLSQGAKVELRNQRNKIRRDTPVAYENRRTKRDKRKGGREEIDFADRKVWDSGA